MDVQVLDIILGVPVLYGIVKGLQKGVIIEATGLIALIIGIYIAVKFSDLTASWLNSNIELDSQFVPAISYALTFLGVCFGIFSLGKVVDKMVNVVMLGWLNRLAGALFGGAKMLLILSGLILLVEGFDQDFHFFPQHIKEASILYMPIKETAGIIIPAVQKSPLFKEIMDLIQTL
ncbi:MAG: membrane protein required for colicin V production [Luteibaculaceae bacterium]|jgi:membrane protein required for colicin V production